MDTNIIIEAYRTGSWRSLTSQYKVETVEDCVIETQTGFQKRNPEQLIDDRELRQSLNAAHKVSNAQQVDLEMRIAPIKLDKGELSLWAHTLSRDDNWVLCGLDRACLRCGVKLKLSERLVSLEELLINIGYRPKTTLRDAYTRKWHKNAINDYFIAEIWGNRRQN